MTSGMTRARLLRALCRLLLAAYPPAFRARFGDALTRDFIAASAGGEALRNALDLFAGGVSERRAARYAGRHLASSRQRASLVDPIMNDIRITLRNLIKRPVYALLVIATLAVGIGANTAVFSLVNGVLLKEMPYRDPARLGFLWSKLDWIGVPRAWVAAPHIPMLANDTKAIESIAGIRTNETQLTGSGEPRMVRMGSTTPNLLDVLGVRPALGRGFVPQDAPAYVALLTHGLWISQFGGDPAIVGKFIELAAERYEVIGVMPENFNFVVHSSLDEPSKVDVWTTADWPLATMSDGSFGFAALVRVRPGETLASAQAQIDVIGERVDKVRFKDRGFGWRLAPLQEDLVGEVRPGLLMLAAAALGILLIVCANVAGLSLVEASRRTREITVRAALGASRRRIIGGIVLDSVMLSMLGGAAGAVLAWISIRAISASRYLSLPRMDDVAMDWRVLLFALALSIAAGIASGLIPAFRAARPNLTLALRDGARGATSQGNRARSMLITVEIALAVMLVAAAGVLFRSFSTLQHIDAGFNPQNVLTADLTLPFARFPEEKQAWQFHRQLAERLAALPGVTAVGAADAPPLSGAADQGGVTPEGFQGGGYAGADGGNVLTVDLIRATPGYFNAMGIPVQKGRAFTWDDRSDTRRVAIVDDVFVRQVWPGGETPLGRTLSFGETKAEIIGVIRHPRLYDMGADDRPQVFLPWLQDTTLGLTIALKTTGDPAALAEPLRQTVWALDPNLPVAELMPMRARVDVSMAERSLQLALLAGFALAALLLASIGLYGMISSSVTQRTQEIGVRAALGASAGSIRTLVLRKALLLAVIGVALGLAGALGIGGVLSRFSFGVTGRDPLTLAATAGLLLAVALLAAYVPARRASRVDPIIALRDA